MKIILIALISIALVGCGAMPGWPGYLETTKSEFDGSTWVRVEPGHASGCCALGAAWNSKTPEVVQIIAVNHGEITAIVSDGGLEFNIDGKILRLNSMELQTQFDVKSGAGLMINRSSSKTFVMQRSDFNTMLAAQSIKVRLNTSRGALEGDLLRDAYGGAAIEGFRAFADQIRRQ